MLFTRIHLLLFLFTVFVVKAEEAPHASRLKRNHKKNQDIRRSPPRLHMDKDENSFKYPTVPRAKGFTTHQSTKSTLIQSNQAIAPSHQNGKPMLRPSTSPNQGWHYLQQQNGIPVRTIVIPQYIPITQMMSPIGIPPLISPSSFIPQNETNPSLSQSIPIMKLPSIPFPTLPPLTMPPSFQRLLGITTTQKPIDERHSVMMSPEEYERQRKRTYGIRQENMDSQEVDEGGRGGEGGEDSSRSSRRSPSSLHLRSVSERLPKFVHSTTDLKGSGGGKADWMVPF